MKLSLHFLTFTVLFFISILLGCTHVNDLNAYDKLYQEYINGKYIDFEHFEKKNKARRYGDHHGYQAISSRFDVIRHRHIFVVLCGRFLNLLRGDYNEDMSWAMLPNMITNLRYTYHWQETDFTWAYNMSMNSADPMIYYAKKFLNSSSGNGISPQTQMMTLAAAVDDIHDPTAKQIPQFCRNLEAIYSIMEPTKISY
ncbi:hypothetical protein ABID23_000391 [Bartonella silvatica]|uniref:Lipoprotein n=1 Tax=Bartonella silvatica TaxID=357760 RepID=A0ABV2HFT3_9HYPH